MTTTLIHSLLYSTFFSIYVLGTLALVPRLWLRHYPAVEAKKQAPPTGRERWLHPLLGVFFVATLFVLPLLSAVVAKGADASGSEIFWHMFALGVMASAVDWLILDWVLVRWLIPADTDPASWRNRSDIIKDAVGFVIGSALAAVWGGIVSVVWF